ncbi:MAG TPA: hypothetical protein VGH32_09280 [Pirellulales bacterium]|jgi:hypothetical protein
MLDALLIVIFVLFFLLILRGIEADELRAEMQDERDEHSGGWAERYEQRIRDNEQRQEDRQAGLL